MNYNQFAPHPALRNYIDAFWTVKGSNKLATERILPDGCVDIILNLGIGKEFEHGEVAFFDLPHGMKLGLYAIGIRNC